MKHDKRKLELLINAAINSKFELAIPIEAAILTYCEEMLEAEMVPLQARIAELEHTRDMLLERIRLLTDEPHVTTFAAIGDE